jgi:hypothetical protein
MKTMNEAELVDVILAELKVICEENDIDAGQVDRDTVLFGQGSIIDSLALVGLIIKVEEFVFERTGKEVQVIDEEAIITEGKTPFRNAATLAALAIVKSNAA